MPLVRPLRGIGYAMDRFGRSDASGRPNTDLTELVCPPYDVITPALQAALLARHDRNAVRLELSAGADPHAAAATTLAAWLRDGTLERRADASVHYYRHARPAAPDEPAVSGVLARVLLEPVGAGIRAHEHTMAGPRADRLALLRATRTQLSPILAIYFDGSPHHDHLLGLPWTDEGRARDGDGLLHSLAAVEPDERMLKHLSRQQLYIADGHHRYETALAYQAEVRFESPRADAPPGGLQADWIMAVLVNAETEDLEIQATHRLVLEADPEALHALVDDAGPIWQVLPVAPWNLEARLAELHEADGPAFGLVLPNGEGHLLVGNPDAVADRMRREPGSDALRGLDLSVLHAAILGDRLGIDATAIAAGTHLAYTRSVPDAIAAVTRGEAKAAILVRPTRLAELAAVANAGEVMPQKSTYFHPKLLTGMVFNSLEGDE
ncbi:MAG: DUF1015 domain-containing protein [Chloroflexota bacterium]